MTTRARIHDPAFLRRCVAAFLVCTLALGGCSRTIAKIGAGAGFGLTGFGLALQAGAFGQPGETHPKGFAFVPLGIGALLLAASAVVLYGTDEDEPAAKTAEAPKPDPAAQQRARDRAAAWEVTKQAAAAARAGDCLTAVKLDGEVRALDPDFHQTVFARDAAIARCLATPVPSPTAAD